MKIGVAQRVHSVDHRPGQHNGECRDADQQHPGGAKVSPSEDKDKADPQQAHHACPEQQHCGRGTCLVFAPGKPLGVRTVGPQDHRPNAGEEGHRGHVPARDHRDAPLDERQEHTGRDQPGRGHDDGTSHR
jgi:hypothetical protein